MRLDNGEDILTRDHIIDASNSLASMISELKHKTINPANYDFDKEEDRGYYEESVAWFNSHRFIIEMDALSTMSPEQYMCLSATKSLRSYIYFLQDELSFSWVTPEMAEFYNGLIYRAQLKLDYFSGILDVSKELETNE